jgi:ATP-dependent exoDNAse (exonuclease V) alpha subunit
MALRKWCNRSGNKLLICKTKNSIQGASLNELQSAALDAKLRDGKQRNSLPDHLEIAIGMQVMVTTNIDTDLDLTNGARGEIMDIVLHRNEPPLPQDPVVQLAHPPAYILVKLKRTRAPQLDGLDEGVIPIQLSTQHTHISYTMDGQIHKQNVTRQQYPITGSYAFTDYRSQGQTIPYVLVDIATPPSACLTLFNIYVALSRSSGRSTIRLLRDFSDEVFDQPLDPALTQEDEQLKKLD